ncbi:MAG: succinylglutamate desuccinylase [Arcobacter sp.]|nr:succinylglutamate desuccinylase [Arcobacter sp.]|tara:strand:+ start:2512 stop:3204 length:693 start_codon:yes stop_codon:yes gene_type:complete
MLNEKNFNLAGQCSPKPFETMPKSYRHRAQDNHPTVFSDIYKPEINIAIWQRKLPATLQNSVKTFLELNPTFQAKMILTPQEAFSRVSESFNNNMSEVSEDIAELVDMFCYLFELKQTAMRLQVLDGAMCPKFHVDRVPCRLVTTYQSLASEWLPHEVLDYTKLGWGSNGLPDSESGLYQRESDIQQLGCGDVALFKGTLWEGNENAGLVHRSPIVPANEKRLVLTLDFN